MVHICCVNGCSNKFLKGSGLGFFRFPAEKNRRTRWLLFLRRKDFKPKISSRICGMHFIKGKPSRDLEDPDYVPSLFGSNHIQCQKGGFTRKGLRNFEELPASSKKKLNTLDSKKEVTCNSDHSNYLDLSVGEEHELSQSTEKMKYPNYVPSVFGSRKKSRPTRSVLNNPEELSVLSSKNKNLDSEIEVLSCDSDHSNYSMDPDFTMDEESESSSEEEAVSSLKTKQPEFEPKIKKFPVINIDTVNRILKSDAAKTPTTMLAGPSDAKKGFNPKLFTFIDLNGKIIARFVEKRIRKNARQSKQQPDVPPRRPVETVQVIVDKKKAKTVVVDKKAICISRTSELCLESKAKKTCSVNLSEKSFSSEAKIKQTCESETQDSSSELENEEGLSCDEYFQFFSEVKDLEQEDKYLRIKIQDVIPVLR